LNFPVKIIWPIINNILLFGMGKFLDHKERKNLLQELKLERSRRYADRIRVILLLDDGETYSDISKFLFLDEGSIANFRKRFKEGGLEALINDSYIGKKVMLSPIELDSLSCELQKKIFPTTKAVINLVKNKFNVVYRIGGMTDLLHRIGFSFKKAKPIPGKANRTEQEKFINRYNGVKSHGLVYFADSTHPEFAPTISYGWIKTGQDFEVKTNSGWRKRVNICGAIEINSLDVIARSHSTINSSSICDLIRAIKRKNDNQDKIYLVLDGAAYNKALVVKVLAKELNVKLLYLPPYSPNLNIIERLWKFMKKKVTANKYFEEFDDFKHTLMEFFRGIRKYKNELRTLLTDNFEIIGT
jgi:transposase